MREGELVAGVVLGYNFGDGHFHDEQLLDAVQERCGFAAGRAAGGHARVPAGAHAERQHYRIFDAADGPGRGGLRSTSPTWSRASPGSTSEPFPVAVDGGCPAPAAQPHERARSSSAPGPNGLACAATLAARGRRR